MEPRERVARIIYDGTGDSYTASWDDQIEDVRSWYLTRVDEALRVVANDVIEAQPVFVRVESSHQ